MREQMLSRKDYRCSFHWGMDGGEVRYSILGGSIWGHSSSCRARGGAALNLTRDNGYFSGRELEDIDFATLFSRYLVDQ
ncbi:hypothetical protein ACKU07_23390 [Enterobacter hormaechei]